MSYPTTISGFSAYLLRAYPWMGSQKTRLGITTGQMDELDAIVGDDDTIGTYFYNLKQYNIAPKRKESILSINLRDSTSNTKKKITEILNDTAASKWNNDDRLVFNRKKGAPRAYTKLTTQIPFECVVDAVPSINGVFDFSARPRGETKRSHLPVGCNAVEMSYAFVQSDIRKATDLPGRVLEKCSGVNDNTNSKTFYKAIFQFIADSALKGFDLHCWFRFINTRYPEFAGKWSEGHIIMIM